MPRDQIWTMDKMQPGVQSSGSSSYNPVQRDKAAREKLGPYQPPLTLPLLKAISNKAQGPWICGRPLTAGRTSQVSMAHQ